jgi:hypothetical protein
MLVAVADEIDVMEKYSYNPPSIEVYPVVDLPATA